MKRKRVFIFVILACGIATSILFCFIRVYRTVTDSAELLSCVGKMTEISWALDQYHNTYGHFPPAFILNDKGEPTHSWRVLLLEFLDPDVYQQYRFEENWDSPHNSHLASSMPKCYRNDSDNSSRFASYVVVCGLDTAFPYEKYTCRSDIKGDPAEVVLLVEINRSTIHWMEPVDLDLSLFRKSRRLSQTLISTARSRGSLVLLADGRRIVLGEDTDLYPMLIINRNQR